MTCELCAAARLTEWFHEDEQCWIAECEACAVPMVVWKVHDPNPSSEVREELLTKLRAVASRVLDGEVWIDDVLRSIPDHYHAHARPRGGFFGHGLRRPAVSGRHHGQSSASTRGNRYPDEYRTFVRT